MGWVGAVSILFWTFEKGISCAGALMPFVFFLSCSGGVWTCPYSLESMSTVNWAIGLSGVYGKGYIPPGALPMSQEDIAKIPIRNIEEVFDEMESSYGQPMPESVRERLDFM